ncbi:MAG: ROK family protein [bacterium]
MDLSTLFANHINPATYKNGNNRKLILKKQIFSILYLEEKKTIADLCIPVKVSIPTMTRLILELIQEGWVIELGAGESRGGRKPVFYGLNPFIRYIIGIEITRKYTRINIFDLHNQPVGETLQLDIEIDNAPEMLDNLRNELDIHLRKNNIDRKSILGAGISIPGLIDKKTNINYSYPNLGNKPLHTIFNELLQIPSFIEHDTKAMALGESWFGLAKNKSNVLCLQVGSGIGLGIIIKGELYQGVSGFSGEFGHIQMIENGELCDCGKIGCLETVSSGFALVTKAKRMIREGTNSIIKKLVNNDIDNIKLPVIIKAAHQGDQFAIELIEESGSYLAKGLAVLIHLLNPEMIIIGGDLSRAENLLADPVQQKLNKYTINRIRQDTSIYISELKEQAGLLGTIPVVMTNIFSQEPSINNFHNSIKS